MESIWDNSSNNDAVEEKIEVLENTNDPEFLSTTIENIDTLPVFNIDPSIHEDELSTVNEPEQPKINISSKEILYHECFEYRQALLREGENIDHIPIAQLSMSLSELEGLHTLYKCAYSKVVSGSITKDTVTTFSSFVSNLFDGSYGIGEFNPNMKGWDDDIQCRIATDPNFRKSINECSLSFSNPWVNLGAQILLSGFSFMRNSKKAKNYNESNIRRAFRGLHEL